MGSTLAFNTKVSQSGSEVYAASSSGNDSYTVTLSPVPAAYVNGLVVNFKPDTANTGSATLNVNGLGAIAITKNNDVALATGDIEANQIVTVVYNSTGPTFNMQSQVAAAAGGGGNWTYVGTFTNSGADCISPALTANTVYQLVINNACDSSSGYPFFQVSIDGGATYLSGSYTYTVRRTYGSTTAGNFGGTGASSILFGTDPGSGEAKLGSTGNAIIVATFCNLATYLRLNFNASWIDTGSRNVLLTGMGTQDNGTAATNIKFSVAGGNFSGVGILYKQITS